MAAATQGGGMQFSARDFRDALSSFATGVTIVTARKDGGEPVGMTASSFNSVSTDPPLILWSVTKTALSAPVFQSAGHFAVHVLATDQTDLSNRFAKSGEDKFAGTDYRFDTNGVPIIGGCAARFDCSTWAVYEGGDHWIIVGRVKAMERDKKEGLVFGGGAYATAAPLTTLQPDSKPSSGGGQHAGSGDATPLENMLFYHLSRAYHRMGHEFHAAVRDCGLTLAEWRILANLHDGVSLPIAILAERTYLDHQPLLDTLEAMAEDGLCKLENNADATIAEGTSLGSSRIGHLLELAHELETAALAGSKPQEQDILFAMLRQIVSRT